MTTTAKTAKTTSIAVMGSTNSIVEIYRF